MKLRQSQDDPASVAVFTSAAPVPEGLGFCKLCPVNVASQFERLIENPTLTRRSRSRSLKRGLGSSRVYFYRFGRVCQPPKAKVEEYNVVSGRIETELVKL
jgi:hypothetical protein